MQDTKNITTVPAKSPLLSWWTHHADDINSACLSATGSIAKAIGLRRELDQAARGEIDIDSPGLRLVIGYLCSDTEDAHRIIQDQRAWQKAILFRGGVA